MKTRLTPPRLVTGGRRRLAVGLMTLLMGLSMALETAQAIPSAPTGGRIHGRAPTATGNLTIRLPGGSSPLTNNAQVIWTAKPNEFTLAPLTPGLTYTDADGDLPAASSITLANPPGVTWTWKKGATPLTAAQLSQPLQSNFTDGTVLTVSASAPVNVTSASGLPNTGSQTFTTPTYNVVVRQPPPPPRIWVNGTTFAIDAGFPKTAFTGAYFQFYMNGTNASANGNYTYSTNQPGWTTVSAAGVVSFTRMPTTAEKSVTITITDTAGVDAPRTYAFTPNLWFVNRGVTTGATSAAAADAYCAGLGNGYDTPSYMVMTNAIYAGVGTRAADGRLWDEWGSMRRGFYGNGWAEDGYWAKEVYGLSRYHVDLYSGLLGICGPYSQCFVACSRSL